MEKERKINYMQNTKINTFSKNSQNTNTNTPEKKHSKMLLKHKHSANKHL
jgi:hypothetical protein